MKDIFTKTCPITQKPCSENCVWLRMKSHNDYDCLLAFIASGEKPMN